MQTLTLNVDSDGVAVISIAVPGAAVNVINATFFAEFDEVVTSLIAADAVRGVVITSARPGGFLAGADLRELVRASQSMTVQEAYEWSEVRNDLFRRMETSGKRFVAAINGAALGGGLELCLACHRRIMADDDKTVCGLPEVSVGLLPGGGGTQRLPRLIGIKNALPLMLKGQHVPAREARELGIVDQVCRPEELMGLARQWVLGGEAAVQPWDVKGYAVPGGAGPLAPHASSTFLAGTALAQSTARNYPAHLAILSAVYEGTQVPIDTGLRIESKYFARLLVDSVSRNLMQTMFLNKGKADRLQRKPQDVTPSTLRKIAVLGAGMMGGGIAYAAARAGYQVALLDRCLEAAAHGKQYAITVLRRQVETGGMSESTATEVLDRIHPESDYAALKDCDMAIEAVFEERSTKNDVLRSVECHLPAHATIASNTSTLQIAGLAAVLQEPGRMIGLHFFSPVERMQLVEVITAPSTSKQALADALEFVGQLKKTPIVVNDGPGFYTTRVFTSYIDEGMCMLQEGVEPALIENAARLAGMPVGPLAITDEVSLELQWRAMRQAQMDGLSPHFCRNDAWPVVQKMTEELKRLGRRAGGGFYDYPPGQKKLLWSGLSDAFPPSADQPSVDLVRQRLLVAQAREAARCIEEGVLTDPAEADLGSVLGVGFPSYTGGAYSFIRTLGEERFLGLCETFATRFGERFRPSTWLIQHLQEAAAS